ncbi:esterase-like activity of phytase family protein [Sphingomonas sp. MG17]|uniref:Esterase-like activity of phytase family protein n=1 Tax=Sphingomonas tagetis TaxID=2949092 RepID=A0A9X2KN65_9SPHN|nr:esterase-like activity of phytase family protein [Sphingomonas tagetis]MCP3729343.1 esterase-like activity of phytase family protein [Sphingomonas tagetis]
MRILLSIILLLALLTDYSGETRLKLLPPDTAVMAEPVALDWRDPARTKLGALTFLGGVWLTSPEPHFGGFSAMAVDGNRFTLLSDGGNVVRFRLDSRWRVSEAHAFALPDGPGTGWSKLDRDTESLTRDPATGQLWVGFERANQIWRYDAALRRAEAHAEPAQMASWPENGGAESMVRLRDGSFIVLAESAKGDPKASRPALWFATDPVRDSRGVAFTYRAPSGYKPTDMTELPDGRLVVIHRRASLRTAFTAVLTIVDRRAIRPGATVTGREIARFEAPVVHDNFEAVAAVREGKDTILWIASDDNQYFFQRSLLLKFRLDD